MKTVGFFLLAIAISACGTAASSATADNDATVVAQDSAADAAVDAAAEVSATAEFIATLADFDCIKNGTKVGHFYVDNRLGQKDAAVAVAKANAKGGQYPLGTVIRLFPLEAMVKRGGKDFASTGGWEMFNLKIDGKAMAIVNAAVPRSATPAVPALAVIHPQKITILFAAKTTAVRRSPQHLN